MKTSLYRNLLLAVCASFLLNQPLQAATIRGLGEVTPQPISVSGLEAVHEGQALLSGETLQLAGELELTR